LTTRPLSQSRQGIIRFASAMVGLPVPGHQTLIIKA
jgi:hypothetical protein